MKTVTVKCIIFREFLFFLSHSFGQNPFQNRCNVITLSSKWTVYNDEYSSRFSVEFSITLCHEI